MSILFGNEPAAKASITGTEGKGGEIYTLVTWNQEGNKFWYPGLINGSVKSIEIVAIGNSGDKIDFNYRLKEGEAPLNKTNSPFTSQERIDYITKLKPSVYP
ncbi:hypothetical protein [Pedobacter jamesrossensis]|uniref:Uncharacterized protein n=1 Tax=Pedobacter jamesrossensis TaxID=1908238 RepID=A0ABV8NK31_9SPHI